MSDTYDDLRKRILEDEAFNGSEADRLKAELLRQFDRKGKKVIVYATFQLLVFLFIMGWGFAQFAEASGVKVMLVGIIALLVGYESTVLIKLWAVVAMSHNRIMREIKGLELRLLAGRPAESAEATAALPQVETGRRRWGDRISVKTVRWIAIVVICAASIDVGLEYAAPAFNSAWRTEALNIDPSKKVLEEHIVVQPDGTCRLVARESHVYAGVAPQEKMEIQSDNAWTEAVWRDVQGNVLPHEVRSEKDGYHYTVHLLRPIFRGELVDVRFSGAMAGWARNESGTWVLANRRTWGNTQPEPLTFKDSPWPREVKITKTIALPPGAQLVSRTPETMAWGDREGRQVLCYQELKKPGELEELRITYRLPGGEASKPAR